MEAKGFGRRMSLLLGICTAFAVVACMGAANAFALSPAVETKPATSIGEKGATLNGLVNPNGLETKAFFEYGTTTSYGSKTTEVSVGSGTSAVESSQAISGLSANTIYHFRIVASNSSGSSQGADQTFTTVGAPAVSAENAGPESSGEVATLKASVDPNGQSTTYQFEYGTESGSYPNVVPIPAESAGSGYEPVTVDRKITGLTPGTTYYWRVSATNASGKVSGTEVSFRSSEHAGIKISPVSELSRTGGTLNATIEPHGSATKYWFEYGTTTSYGSKTATKEVSKEVESAAVSEVISGLKANTVYHYRVMAENLSGTHTGSDQTFTTLKNATLYYKGSGELVKVGAPLKAYSTNLTFTGEGTHSCSETEFAGELTENPGVLQSVATTKVQNGGAGTKCPWKTSYTIAYSIPTKGMTLEYALNGSGEGFAKTSKFALLQTVYFEKTFKVAECEYNLTLSGPFTSAKSLEPTLSGKTEVVKGNPACPGAESVSGNFLVTSNEFGVEAK